MIFFPKIIQKNSSNLAAFHKLPPKYDQNNYIGNHQACQLKGNFRIDFLIMQIIFFYFSLIYCLLPLFL